MSKKLHPRKLNRKSLVKGKYNYILCLRRSHWRVYSSVSNRREMSEIRSWLKSACDGNYLVDKENNRKNEVVYTRIYLCRPMDVAMIKLTHSDKLWRIYEIIPESRELCE